MAKLLVTGAAGFIGSNFVRLALRQGHEVLGVDSLTYAGHRESLQDLPEGRFQLEILDIRSPKIEDCLRSFRPDALLNFAAESHVDRSIAAPLLFVETNVLGTANLLQASLEYWRSHGSFRFLQVSTDEVFGSLGAQGFFSETTAVHPSSPYSASKAGADHLVQAWHHTYGLPTILTRCSNNYGPYQLPEKLIPHMILQALQGKQLPVYGDGKNVRDWIHVEDHCRALLLALERGRPGATFCLGGRSERNNLDLVRMICQILDEKAPRADKRSHSDFIAFVADRPGHDFRYAIDGSLAERELGFSPEWKFEEGLQATVDWYLQRQDWIRAVNSQPQRKEGR